MPLVLALDQGGHASRALVFDGEGRVRARALVEVAEIRSGDDRVEQDAVELVRSLEEAAARALDELAPGDTIARAGLATQRSSLVCWDRRTGDALSPVLSWQDRRAANWLARFEPRAAEIRERTGLRLSPHYGASKLRWCLDHLEPVACANAEGRLAAGPLASFLAARLSGAGGARVDPANAQRTLLYSLAKGDWDPALLELFGIPRAVLPECLPTHADFGALSIGGRTIPLEVLTGDQSAALFAWGAPREDTVYVNLGTGAFVQRPQRSRPAGLPRLLASIVAREGEREIHVVEGTVNGAGSALDAFAAEIGVPGFDSELTRALDTIREPPIFVNGVSGLGAPFWKSDLRSRFIGEGDALARLAAVGESIVFLIGLILEEMETDLPHPARILASGGLARVDGLCQRLANLSRLPVERSDEHEATARGLATLLGVVGRDASSGERFEPARADALEKRQGRFRSELMAALGRLA
jgi:glycerol kinase